MARADFELLAGFKIINVYLKISRIQGLIEHVTCHSLSFLLNSYIHLLRPNPNHIVMNSFSFL